MPKEHEDSHTANDSLADWELVAPPHYSAKALNTELARLRISLARTLHSTLEHAETNPHAMVLMLETMRELTVGLNTINQQLDTPEVDSTITEVRPGVFRL